MATDSSTTELANIQRGLARPAPREHAHSGLDIQDVYYLAQEVAKSRLFAGFENTSQAFTLMMICQSEGLHPMQALKRYDVIDGRPALKSAALQAEFLARGGSIKILHLDDDKAGAVFSHPRLAPEPIERWCTFKQFENTYAKGKDGSLKKNWRNSRSDMLWARLVSFVRKIDPGIATGIPFGDDVFEQELEAEPSHQAFVRPRHVEPIVLGQPEGMDLDSRPYHQIVKDAFEALKERVRPRDLGESFKEANIHGFLTNAAVQQGLMDPPRDRKALTVLNALSGLYGKHRDWLRNKLNDFLEERIEEIQSNLQIEPEIVEDAAESEPAGRDPGEDG